MVEARIDKLGNVFYTGDMTEAEGDIFVHLGTLSPLSRFPRTQIEGLPYPPSPFPPLFCSS